MYPIIIATYNRLDKINQLISSLQKNAESKQSDLFIFSDHWKLNDLVNKMKVLNVRAFLKKIKGFNSITIVNRDKNYGMAKNIIHGINFVLKKKKKTPAFIYLDDDLIVSRYFLKYMNYALSYYKNKKKVTHISGYYYPEKKNNTNFFFTKLTLSWGWGSWRREWINYKNDPDYYIKKFYSKKIFLFNYDNANNFWQQVLNNKSKKRKTYSIYLYCQSFLKNGVALCPKKSYVFNNGADGSGVHVPSTSIYDTTLQSRDIEFKFPKKLVETNRTRKYLIEYFISINKQKFKAYIFNFLEKIFNRSNQAKHRSKGSKIFK